MSAYELGQVAPPLGEVQDEIDELAGGVPEVSANSMPESVDESLRRGVMQRISNAYFRPKSFESEKLYERLGIGFAKKYMPTSGDWMMRNVWHSNVMQQSGSREERVTGLDRTTRTLEAIHLGALASMQTLFTAMGAYERPSTAAIVTSAQLAANVYPIMLQRYNRLRTTRVLRTLERRNADS